jgi:hypothetical protein
MVKERRMITDDWSRYDMMNVVFRPKNMSPWELQEEFYRAGVYFYDKKSSDEIGRIFGKEYGRRRKWFGAWPGLVSGAPTFARSMSKKAFTISSDTTQMTRLPRICRAAALSPELDNLLFLSPLTGSRPPGMMPDGAAPCSGSGEKQVRILIFV